MSRGMTIVLLVAVIALVSIGVGAAYSATSSSGGNTIVTDMAFEATAKTVDTGQDIANIPADSSKLIYIPGAQYVKHGSVWDPAHHPYRTLTGTVDIVCDVNNGAILDIWVDFKDIRSLTLIESIKFTYGGVDYDMFLYGTDTVEEYAPQCGYTASIPVSNGTNQAFSITVVYKEDVTVDPGSYSGTNLKTNLMFLMKPKPVE